MRAESAISAPLEWAKAIVLVMFTFWLLFAGPCQGLENTSTDERLDYLEAETKSQWSWITELCEKSHAPHAIDPAYVTCP